MKKPYRIAIAAFGLAWLAMGLVLRFALHREYISFSAAGLCMIGLALSFDCKSEKYRVPLRMLQALALIIIVASGIGWLIAPPHWYELALNLAALGVNVPLAVMGIKKK